MSKLDIEMAQIQNEPWKLNNFVGYLPHGFFRRIFIIEPEAVPFEDTCRRLFEPREYLEGRSCFEMLSDINNSVYDLNIPLEKIEELQKSTIVGGDTADLELTTLTLSVYRQMREKGYTRLELTT